MAEHKCEDLDPTDDPTTVPTAILATSDQTFNPSCAHNSMATWCNQSQYPSPNPNPTVKTWNPLIFQMQYQPLCKPPVITPSILIVLIT